MRTDVLTPIVEPVVELVGVSKVFGEQFETPVHALRGVSMIVNQHDSVAIVGPSGSGKSTLLNVLGCLDLVSSGQYRLNGVDVSTLSDPKRAAIRGREIGFVFQQFHLLPHRSVIDNVELGSMYGTASCPPRARRDRLELAMDALDRVGLTHRVDAAAKTLSGGEKQRVAIARAIADAPSLLLADEPTGNLDSENTISVLEVFERLRDEGLTLVTITHDLSVARRFQRCISITDGHLTEMPRDRLATLSDVI